ncbi:MAG: protein-glutamate O-methyltransferase [Actinobacteria bacterium]|nr:protein-glutamate O-methyltransferase [Actinomycetota bacterium]
MQIKCGAQFKIDDREFGRLKTLIKELTGINLTDQKKTLVVARLSKRLRALGLSSFAEYYYFLTETGDYSEVTHLINRITTNKTDFFRERHHFEFLTEAVLPGICEEGEKNGTRKLRIWSAGCSSGEEPYTIAITLCEYFLDKAGWDIKILATDLDTEMLEKARAGIYCQDGVAPVPPEYLRKYFKKGVNANTGRYMAKDKLKKMVIFKRHNLTSERYPFNEQIDVVLCRNVIIYFDEATKAKVINSFHDVLRDGGVLFLGHSESAIGNESRFKLIGNSTFRKTTLRSV